MRRNPAVVVAAAAAAAAAGKIDASAADAAVHVRDDVTSAAITQVVYWY